MTTQAPPMLAWMTLLADPIRTRLLRVLDRRELTVAELCEVLGLPQSTVSRHLKVLADEGWVDSRREGTSRLYHLPSQGVPADAAARRLWALLREQVSHHPAAQQDDRRLLRTLQHRQTRSQEFFSSAAGQWDKLRKELFGDRFDLHALCALLDEQAVVGDLGCGTGQLAACLAPHVKKVVAIDNSPAMLKAARQRLKAMKHVEVLRGEVASLPLEDASLDLAVLSMVLHHQPGPGTALAEVARVLRPGGRVLIVDMLEHDRQEFAQQMGHQWLGFAPAQIQQWLEQAQLRNVRIVELAVDEAARGPALFCARASKENR